MTSVYGLEFKEAGLLHTLGKKDKNYLYGTIFKWIKEELVKDMKFTIDDKAAFGYIKDNYNIRSWREVVILLRFGFINNKQFPSDKIYNIINGKLSKEEIKKIVSDEKMVQKFKVEVGAKILEDQMADKNIKKR